MKYTYLIIAVTTLVFSCSQDCEKEVDLSGIALSVSVENEGKQLFLLKSPLDAHLWLNKHPLIANQYFQRSAFPNDSLLANYLYNFYSNLELAVLQESTDSSFGNLDQLHEALVVFFKHVKYYYPKFYVPKVYTLISGFKFDRDLIVSDSVIIVSLDYFLGRKAKYRPPFYSYFLERYEKEYIVPMISLGVSNNFNQVDLKDETMIASMIYYGKAYYFAKVTQPCIPDSLIVQYSTKQLKDIHENEEVIWGHFIEHKLLFETKPQVIEKYVGESPRVNEIGENCPGRIGRWLGWKIVEQYSKEHPELSVQEILAEKDAQKIFRMSKYNPSKN